MNKNINVFDYLKTRQIDLLICRMDLLLQVLEDYHLAVQDQRYFSAQALLLSKKIEENRSGVDAIRVSMKALEIVSPTFSTALQ